MMYLLLGLALFLVALYAANVFTKVDARALARGLKSVGGYSALAGAAGLAATGRFTVALPLGLAGMALLGWLPSMASFGQRTTKTEGQTSRVRSAFVEMELDHDTGALRGTILAGHYEGQSLDALDVPSLIGLLTTLDEESRALIAAYLDRRDPTWRENAQGNAGAGRDGSARGGPMTSDEAYQILGLQAGASADEIRRAHRTLMKKLHPDQGGSTYLASRVNEAKDILLSRHH